MKNDLTKFEKDLLKAINLFNNKNYNHNNFMEWSSDRSVVEKNLRSNEIIYNVMGVYVVIKIK